MANGHGGNREGAGRKPKALRYESQISSIEERIIQILPRVVDKMIEMALDGDLRAGRYLVDRIMGRVPVLDAPPSMDQSIPYSEREFTREILERNMNLSEDELRLQQRAEDMFEYVGDEDDNQTYDELIPMSPEETEDLLRKARVEQEQREPDDINTAGCTEIDADDSGPEMPASTEMPFIPSDSPDDPDRTWYYPD